MILAPGTTSYSLDVQILDDSGLAVTGLVAATFPSVSYSLGANVAASSISLSDLAAITTAYSSGGVKERSGGFYRLDLPNAALSSAGTVQLIGEATGKHVIAPKIQVQKTAATVATGDNADIPAARAAKIDNLDATVSSRAPATAIPAGFSAIGSTSWDGIDSLGHDYDIDGSLPDSPGIGTILAAVANLNNLSALANLYGPPLLEIPDSTTAVYQFGLTIRDTEGHLVDLDSLPTLAAVNATGTSRSGNLSIATRTATGRYTFSYSVTSAATEEGLRISATGAVSSSARYIEIGVAVVNYDSITMIAAIKAKTDLLVAGTTGYPAVDVYGFQGSSSKVTLLSAMINNYTVAGGKFAATIAAGDAVDFTPTRLSAIDTAAAQATAAASGIANITSNGAVKLPPAPAGYGGFVYSGARPIAVTVYLPDGTTPAAAAVVRIAQGVNSQSMQADSSGHVTFSVDDGPYTLAIVKGGYSFTPTTITVDATHTTFSEALTAISLPSSPIASQCRLYFTAIGADGLPKNGVQYSVRVTAGPASANDSLNTKPRLVTSNSTDIAVSGMAPINAYFDMLQGSKGTICRGVNGNPQPFTAPAQGNAILSSIIPGDLNGEDLVAP